MVAPAQKFDVPKYLTGILFKGCGESGHLGRAMFFMCFFSVSISNVLEPGGIMRGSFTYTLLIFKQIHQAEHEESQRGVHARTCIEQACVRFECTFDKLFVHIDMCISVTAYSGGWLCIEVRGTDRTA